jgi:hypothetical protein
MSDKSLHITVTVAGKVVIKRGFFIGMTTQGVRLYTFLFTLVWLWNLRVETCSILQRQIFFYSLGSGYLSRYSDWLGMNGPGIESRWERIFRTRPHRSWGSPSLLYNGYRVSFSGVKRLGWGVNHLSRSSAEVKERIELYLYSLSVPSCPVLGLTLPDAVLII